jgi:hypothetical protein
MFEPLNVYRHDDGHYVFTHGPAGLMRGVSWLGVVDMDSLSPLLRETIHAQLQRDPYAMVSAAQFYAPAPAGRATLSAFCRPGLS